MEAVNVQDVGVKVVLKSFKYPEDPEGSLVEICRIDGLDSDFDTYRIYKSGKIVHRTKKRKNRNEMENSTVSALLDVFLYNH